MECKKLIVLSVNVAAKGDFHLKELKLSASEAS